MDPKKVKLTEEEELKAQNEIDALNLELLYGANTFISEDMPPEIIAAFLANVKQFEDNHANGQTISIKEYLEHPEYPSLENVDNESIPVLIDLIEKKLVEKNIVLERPKFLSDKGWYKFLVNEIMEHQFTPPIEGTMLFLDYDEFRQDSPEYIGIVTQKMIESIIDLDEPYEPNLLAEECRNSINQITKEEAIEAIHAFRKKYKEIIPIAFSNMEQKATATAMFQIFGVSWKGVDHDGEEHSFDGIGVCQLAIDQTTRTWKVEGIEFPGFGF
jgi:hypothetical protein